MFSDHLAILTASIKNNVYLFQHLDYSKNEPEANFFKSVIAEMLQTLPHGWNFDRVVEMLTLYFLFEGVPTKEDLSGKEWTKERAAQDLLQSCPFYGFDDEKAFLWLVQLTGKFRVFEGKEFLTVVKTLPEYFNNNPIVSIGIH